MTFPNSQGNAASAIPVWLATSGDGGQRNVTSVAYVADEIIKAAPGTLFNVSGYNSGAAQFIQIFDSATLPADTAVPVVVIAVAATSNFSYCPGVYGRQFGNGIVICNSSTGPTKTIGAANCWFDSQYL